MSAPQRLKTALELQEAARLAVEAGDEDGLMEAQAELINRFVLSQRIMAIKIDGAHPDEFGVYPIHIELENLCALMFLASGANPFAVMTTRPD